jgi:hypothetical protein
LASTFKRNSAADLLQVQRRTIIRTTFNCSRRARLGKGRLDCTAGIAWDDNRSLISRRVNIPLGFLGMVFATAYEHKALARDVSGV